MATTPRKKPATAGKAAGAAATKKPAAAAKAPAAAKPAPKKAKAAARPKDETLAATTKAAAVARAPVDASRPLGDGPVWDGDPDKIPNYQADTDIVSAVISQFGLIRGVWGKIRAVGVILLRVLP